MDKEERFYENENEEIICHECGMKLKAWDEYHPLGFCVLWKAGIEPKKFVREASFAIRYVIPERSE